MVKHKVKVGDKWEDALLSEEEVMVIHQEIEGLFITSRNIKLTNGKLVGTYTINGIESYIK